MKQEILFIHGGEAFSRYEDFLNHLKNQEIKDPLALPAKKWTHSLVEDLGVDVAVYAPQMPNKQNAKYQEWKIWFERYLEFVHDGVILVGWSLGGWFLVKYLLENPFPHQIKGLILLAAPFKTDDFGVEDGGDFVFNPKKLPGSLSTIANIYLLHSQDDFIVPYDHVLHYQKALPHAKLVTFTDRNHFLQEKLPELIDLIRDLSQ